MVAENNNTSLFIIISHCFTIRVSESCYMNPSTKFPRSYTFLKCPALSRKYKSRKRRLKNPSLGKKNPAHKYFSGIWANQRLGKTTTAQFSRTFYFLNSFVFRLSSHVCAGINIEINFYFSRLWK